MPGVIQPQRPPGAIGGALSAFQAVGAAKSAFGGGGGQAAADQTQQTSAGNVGDSSQAAQGQAVQANSGAMGDYPGGGNVFQRRMQRTY